VPGHIFEIGRAMSTMMVDEVNITALNTITLTLHYILYDLIYYSFVFMKLV
jgi:hypothetical protein